MLLTANIFQPLIDVFETVLKFFHNSVGVPWGWSIVLLTIAIRALLVPLTLKQFHSMQAMQRLQPEIKALQNKYKDDKQRQQQEMMKFYRENNFNPLGSCLPLVAQLPVMISLFYMLRQDLRIDICSGVQRHAAALAAAAHAKKPLAGTAGNYVACGPGHHANFLFISDLTNKATGATLIVLIVLYVGTQLASTLVMQSPTMDQTQRRMMLFMPLIFVAIVINFPAGVLVYWITTNTWAMLQGYIVKRRIGPVGGPAVATAGGPDLGGSGTGGSGGGSKPGGGSRGPSPKPESNGDSPTGLAGLLRGRAKEAEAPATVGGRGGPPPRSPRKKKKRSGRRR
jgi:YidC/Oxa1 family membrane protein insertase